MANRQEEAACKDHSSQFRIECLQQLHLIVAERGTPDASGIIERVNVETKQRQRLQLRGCRLVCELPLAAALTMLPGVAVADLTAVHSPRFVCHFPPTRPSEPKEFICMPYIEAQDRLSQSDGSGQTDVSTRFTRRF